MVLNFFFPFSGAFDGYTGAAGERSRYRRTWPGIRFLIADCAATNQAGPAEIPTANGPETPSPRSVFCSSYECTRSGAWVSQTIEEARIANARQEIECVATARQGRDEFIRAGSGGGESASPLALRAQYEEAAAAAAEDKAGA